ncbi:Alpha-ketoglutarate-dependent dioxygenase alkB [Linum grandiflorum]
MYRSDIIADEAAEHSAFKRAEKKYKLYYEQSSKKKKKPKPVDLSEVLDFDSILSSSNHNEELPHGIAAVQSGGFDRPVFLLESHPGFYFLPGALSVEEQCRWIREGLTSFPQPPNRTNHNAIYGPISNLFDAAKDGKVLLEDVCSNGDGKVWRFCDDDGAISRGDGCKSVSASVLLRKLRWSTLGLQFDWSKRNYNVSLPHKKIPEELCELARKLAAPAMPMGDEFRPEAAIVNYFGLGDTLGGHLDDMEEDWSKPIVSMSLGCKAIFLLGGKSRDDPPLAMFLRSGDVVLMAGQARECFHGVPRIFIDEENAEITRLETHFSEESHTLDYIRTSRININIRQVF